MVSVYLSPHLDDAVLSCGGRIAATADAGEDQRVITCFAGSPSSGGAPEQLAAFVALRREEDRRALAVLGVRDVLQLELLDAIYRQGTDGLPLYSKTTLYEQVSRFDEPLLSRLEAQLVERLPAPADLEIFAPLAIGNHVDHQLVQRVGERLAARGYRVRYYEDLPYAVNPASLSSALTQRIGWCGEELVLEETHLERKLQALRQYVSQLEMLFRSTERMDLMMRQYACGIASEKPSMVERVWYPVES